jgi:transposase
MKRWKPETRREIVMKLRAEGKSLEDIRKQLGVSQRTVCYDVAAWREAAVSSLQNSLQNQVGFAEPGCRDEVTR